MKTKGAEHRNIKEIWYKIPVRCTLFSSISHLPYKYVAALPLSGDVELPMYYKIYWQLNRK